MSIRRTITLLTVPLFLALALVNGALLYFQERAELAQALSDQALAAAITSAEFIAAMDRPAQALAAPARARALRKAASQIPGLDGLYLVMPGGQTQALVASPRPWRLDRLRRPGKPVALAADSEGNKPRHVVALAPAAGGAFVAARIDAEPMFATLAAIRKAMLLAVLLAGVIAAALAWFVARRIVRELDLTQAAITAGGTASDDLTIREVRDLAGAVRLMEASAGAAAERSIRVTAHRDRERTAESALAAIRAAEFAPLAASFSGARVAVRISGEAVPGTFFALAGDENRGIVVAGICGGASPREAFARALEARRFITANVLAMPAEACMKAVTAAQAIEDLRFIAWTRGEAPDAQLLVLGDAQTAERAAAYARGNPDADAEALLDGIDALLAPAGLFAAVTR